MKIISYMLLLPLLLLSPLEVFSSEPNTQEAAAKIENPSTKLSRAEALELYKKLLETLPEEPKESMSLLIDLMEKGQMPVFFPNGDAIGPNASRYFEPLQINPFSVRVSTTSNPNIDCEPQKGAHTSKPKEWITECLESKSCPVKEEPGVVVGDSQDNKIKCRQGNQIYWTGAGIDTIYDSYGDEIIEAGSGDDIIDVNYGRHILIFRQGWGKDKVTDRCLGNPVAAKSMHESEAKNEWVKAGYPQGAFVVFGPGIFPQDMEWQGGYFLTAEPKVLKNIKTGDQISFSPSACFSFVFYEGGSIESYEEYGEKDQKRKKQEEVHRIENLKLPEKFGGRVKSCTANASQICHLQIALDVAKDITDLRNRCSIMASIGKSFVDSGQIALSEQSISFIEENITLEPTQGTYDGGDFKTCDHGALNQFILSLAKAGEIEKAKRLIPHIYSYNQQEGISRNILLFFNGRSRRQPKYCKTS